MKIKESTINTWKYKKAQKYMEIEWNGKKNEGKTMKEKKWRKNNEEKNEGEKNEWIKMNIWIKWMNEMENGK